MKKILHTQDHSHKMRKSRHSFWHHASAFAHTCNTYKVCTQMPAPFAWASHA